MCAFKTKIKNPRYKPNKKNGGVPPLCEDERKAYIEIPCGTCIECRKKKTNDWKMRLYEELRELPKDMEAKFVTFTFTDEWLDRLESETEHKDANEVAKIAIKYFRERWRWFYKKSPKHWFVTELGHNNTERLHIHGIIIIPKGIINDEYIRERDGNGNPKTLVSNKLTNIWKYGFTTCGAYCNEKTITYITKYVTKLDTDHEGFKGKIFVSPGIGKSYVQNEHVRNYHHFENRADKTITTYKFTNGTSVNLCEYYRRKLYSELEIAKLWTFQLDKGVRWLNKTEFRAKKMITPIYWKGEIDGWEYWESWKEYEEAKRDRQNILNRIGLGRSPKRYYESRYGRELSVGAEGAPRIRVDKRSWK